jgi:hypothetical protein
MKSRLKLYLVETYLDRHLKVLAVIQAPCKAISSLFLPTKRKKLLFQAISLTLNLHLCVQLTCLPNKRKRMSNHVRQHFQVQSKLVSKLQALKPPRTIKQKMIKRRVYLEDLINFKEWVTKQISRMKPVSHRLVSLEPRLLPT